MSLLGQLFANQSRFFEPGVFRLEVLRCRLGPKSAGGVYFAADFRVLESTAETRPPGCKCHWVAGMGMYQRRPRRAVIGFIETATRSLLGPDRTRADEQGLETEIAILRAALPTYVAQDGSEGFAALNLGSELLEAVAGADNILAGAELELTAHNISYRHRPFLIHEWELPEEMRP